MKNTQIPSIWKKTKEIFFYFAKLNKIAKPLGTELVYPDTYRNGLLKSRQAKIRPLECSVQLVETISVDPPSKKATRAKPVMIIKR